MKYTKKTKITAYALVLMFAISLLSFANIDTQAASKTKKENYATRYALGSTLDLSNVADVKINGKPITSSALRGQVSIIKTATHYNRVKLRTAAYYSDSSQYKSYAAYEKKRDSYKYYTTFDYSIRFLRPTTFKITFTKFTEYEYKYDQNKRCGLYLPGTRTITTYNIKVSGNTAPIKSIKLGKAISSYTVTGTQTQDITTDTYYPYLGKKNAKLLAKANPGFKITSILVVTKDPQTGYTRYKVVKNGKTIPVNTYKPKNSVTNPMPATTIYVAYKDTFTGVSTTYSQSADGRITTTNRYWSSSEKKWKTDVTTNTYPSYGSYYQSVSFYYVK